MKRVALLLMPVLALFGLIFTTVVVLGSSDSSAAEDCVPSLPGAGDPSHLTVTQWRNARMIITIGRAHAVPARGWVIAIATALQESGLVALPYGDRDSIGLFQQRAAWGTYAQRLNPTTSSGMFYTGGHGGQPGLLDIPRWQQLPLGKAAQAVQHSAYPGAYAKWEPMADAIVHKITGDSATGCLSPGKWVSPVKQGSFVLTARFGECGGHWEHCHTGLDFAAPLGTPAMAASVGVVTFSGLDGPYGNLVKVLHAHGIATWYAHLHRRLVHVGQRVRAGEVVGLIGETGNAFGTHLHFEVRTHASQTVNGTPIDPLPWLRQHGALP